MRREAGLSDCTKKLTEACERVGFLEARIVAIGWTGDEAMLPIAGGPGL